MRLLIASTLFFLAQTGAEPPPDSSLSLRYYLVFLRPDPARKPIAKEEGERIQTAHMANIRAMADRGVLVAAGPFDDPHTTISGIFIFRTSSLAEAQRIANEDPTVTEHRNMAEVHAWWGPKGLGEEYARLHKEKPETPQYMGVQPLFLIYRGSQWADRDKQAAAHAEYLARLRREGKLAMEGATEGDDNLSAIAVFRRIPDEDAQHLMAEDPAVKANIFKLEYHRWWCAEHVLPN